MKKIISLALSVFCLNSLSVFADTLPLTPAPPGIVKHETTPPHGWSQGNKEGWKKDQMNKEKWKKEKWEHHKKMEQMKEHMMKEKMMNQHTVPPVKKNVPTGH